MPFFPKVKLLGVYIDNVDVEEVLAFIKKTINSNKRARISYVNIHAINLCYEIKWFRDFINSSQLVFCDGYGIHLGSLMTGQKLNHRLSPPDWIDLLCQNAVHHNWVLFFLGAKPEVAKLAAQKLVLRHPGLIIQTHHGFFNHFGSENEQVLKEINESKAQIIVVGMGMPLQEHWINENLEKLSSTNIFFPVGAMFDYIADTVPRGPKWLTNIGFEWLARLIIEPKRLWHRYLIGIPVFFIRLIFHQYFQKEISN